MSVRDYKVVQCQACEFLFVNPRPDEATLKTLYSDIMSNPFLSAHFESTEDEIPTLRQVLDIIQSVKPSGRLLEIGCGKGDLLQIAQQRGFEVEGTDLGTPEEALGRFQIHLGPLRTLGLKPNSYDVVVTRNTLEHLFDPNVELEESRKLLKPGGVIYLKVPNSEFEHGVRCMLAFQRKHQFSPPWHLNHFTPKTLNQILQRNDFQVLSWRIEKPTRRSKWIRDFIQQTGYKAIDTCRKLSFGRLFPKPILVCLAQAKD